jgi:hypothetical protein
MRGGFDQLAENRAAWLKLVLQAEHGEHETFRFWSGEADDTNTSASRWRGNGDDGIVEIHSVSFKFPVSSFKSGEKILKRRER